MTIEELKKQKQWINWNYKTTKDNKKTKVPISYNGQPTGTNKDYSHTWTTYENAYKSLNKYNGIGIIFDNGLCGIDIDHKDKDDPIVKDIINLMDTYTELSPSKTGYHLLFMVDLDKLPTIINDKGDKKLDSKYYQKNPHNQIECYIDGLTNRYFTFTGNVVNDKPICERTNELLMFLDKYMIRDNQISNKPVKTKVSSKSDDEIIELIRNTNDKFSKLYDEGDISIYDNDSSSADMGLCCILAQYTQDFNQIDRIFKTSKLYRDKWDREDYKEMTINKAISMQSKSFFNQGKFLFQEFAEYLIDTYHIYKINNRLHIYKGGVYVADNDEIESVMLDLIPNLSSSRRNETMKALRLLNVNNKKLASPNYIAFNNGIYNIEKDEFIPFDPNIIITNKIPWDYVKDTNNPYADKVLNDWANGDSEVNSLLEEIIGMCMFRSNAISSCFIIVGGHDNGKSKFIHMLQYMLGEENYSSVGLEDIEKRFKNADLYGKLANLGDDIGDNYISSTAIFKKLVTGETLQVERKGQDPFSFKNTSKMIFNANNIPRIKDDTGAVIEKRITIIPFNNTFKAENCDPFLDNKMNTKEFMQHIISRGITGLKRVLSNNKFTECEITKKAKEEYILNNDPVAQFINEYGKDNIYLHYTNEVLSKYRLFCYQNSFKSDTPQTLNKGIKRILGYEKVQRTERDGDNRKTTYIYADTQEH